MPISKEETINFRATGSGTQFDENQMALLALTLTPNLGPKRISDAIAGMECPAQLFALTLTELEGLRFPADAAQFLFDGKARRAAEEEAEQILRQKATLISLASAEYP